MNLLVAPPYLQERLRQVVASHPGAAELMAAGELHVVSRLEHCLAANVVRAAVVAAAPEQLQVWARSEAGLAAASNALAGAAAAAAMTDALVVDEAALRANPSRELASIIGFVAGDLGCWRAPATLESEPSPQQVSAELAALSLYSRLPLEQGATALWPAELFRSGETGFPGPIDITGAARNLIFGPYLCLPPGLWEASLEFEVCEAAAQYDYPIDFGVLNDFARRVARPAGPGRQIANVRHAFASSAPVELRLWLGRAAFHGELRLHGAKLTYLGAGAEAPSSMDEA